MRKKGKFSDILRFYLKIKTISEIIQRTGLWSNVRMTTGMKKVRYFPLLLANAFST